jgi:hypothetical protein
VCVCVCVPSVTVCAVLKDGVYFTTEGSGGLKALSKRLRDVETLYDAKQVRRSGGAGEAVCCVLCAVCCVLCAVRVWVGGMPRCFSTWP